MPRTKALAEVYQYLICLFATPVGEENCIVPGYLEISANQHDMRVRQKHYAQRKKITLDSVQKDRGGDPSALPACAGTKLHTSP